MKVSNFFVISVNIKQPRRIIYWHIWSQNIKVSNIPVISVSNLLTHLKSIHKGVKYPCDQCDFKGTDKSSLLRHLNSKHKGVKYPSDQCDFQATQNSSLLTHLNSIHKGIQRWSTGSPKRTDTRSLVISVTLKEQAKVIYWGILCQYMKVSNEKLFIIFYRV